MAANDNCSAEEIEAVVEEYGNMLFRVGFVMLGNRFDAEDAVQETFIKYLKKCPKLSSKEHEKAWLIRVVTNKCRDILRFRFRHNALDIDTLEDFPADAQDEYILRALYELPAKLKSVMYLYYVEEYKTREIAGIIGKTESAVKMRLKKGREELKKKYLAEVSK